MAAWLLKDIKTTNFCFCHLQFKATIKPYNTAAQCAVLRFAERQFQ
jgi:hypothetical protein